MSALEGFHTINGEVYGGRRENRFGRAESIALPLERFSAGREAHNLVWKPRETNGVNNVQQTSFGPREALDGTLRGAGASLDLVLTPAHWLVRMSMTVVSEMNKARKMYVAPVTAMIKEWQSPLGRIAAEGMTTVIIGAWALTIAQGFVLGALKGTYGLLRDKVESVGAHLFDHGKTYFQSAAEAYASY